MIWTRGLHFKEEKKKKIQAATLQLNKNKDIYNYWQTPVFQRRVKWIYGILLRQILKLEKDSWMKQSICGRYEVCDYYSKTNSSNLCNQEKTIVRSFKFF